MKIIIDKDNMASYENNAPDGLGLYLEPIRRLRPDETIEIIDERYKNLKENNKI